MIDLHERIRLALLKEWVQSLYALRNLENVNARHRVLTPDEEAELSAAARHYTWIAQRYGKLSSSGFLAKRLFSFRDPS